MHPVHPWKGSLFAAVPTPVSLQGDIHLEAVRQLIYRLAPSSVRGVAIGTHLGRGSRLTSDRWDRLVSTWREGLTGGKILVASAEVSSEFRRPLEIFDNARATAQRSASLGVDTLLVLPPAAIRGRPDRDRLILEYHSALAAAGLPILLSYRRESSGGIAYGPEVLAQLLARPEVLGIEIATIDGIATFQQVEALTRELAPGKVVISGEERFLGYSLMCGADAALVGMGAVAPELVAELLEAYFAPDPARFLSRSHQVDALARSIFRLPIEGATLRLLQKLADLGIIPIDAANDTQRPIPGRNPPRLV